MNSLQCQITAEQLRAVYRQLPTIVSAVAGAGMLVFILRDVHSSALLFSWLAIVLLNCLAAVLLYLYYIKVGRDSISQPCWKTYFFIFTLCTGTIWGSIGMLFYFAPTEYKLLIVVWIWAMGAGMVALLVAYRPAFYAMLIPLFMPLMFCLATDEYGFYRGLSVATFMWLLSLMYFYHGNHKTFTEAISLRFINAELAEDLARKNKEAENANLAKSQFLAAASHDLRQPLHAQSLFLAELDHYVDNLKGRRILGGLESSVYAMRKLLNAILDISKLDAGTISPSIEVFSISTIFANLRSEFENLAAEKNIILRMRECYLVVTTDPVLLERMLRNLIANAVRYTSEGKVLVGCRRHKHHVSIQIMDTGIGIPDEKQEDIFTPFIQLGNPERDREKGLGLGLSIVQRTADLLGLTLSLKSTPGKGTVVSIDVPLSNQMPVKRQNDLPATDEANINGKCVLIIDDDSDVRIAMSGLLESWGCLPLAFSDMQDALEYIKLEYINQKKVNIDVIFSDFTLSGNGNGIQVIAELRALCGSTIPAALITGDTSVERLQEAKDSNHLIIHKPVLADELRAVLNRLVG
ncbi:hypothetical protein MNBD_GAMMA06-937 [hydrothermal vent metagenome]|uniref:histidine kinase n=1 Tax=hydrothermal vent metagenome TaxID=652676 RepID=A0A3B0WJ60_9ZZZZ